jgi:hypothetical protein
LTLTKLAGPADVAYDLTTQQLDIADQLGNQVLVFTTDGALNQAPLTGLAGPNSVAVG